MLFFVVWAVDASAEPKTDVQAVLESLRQTSFSWETTARQYSTRTVDASGAAVRPEAGAALVAAGKNEPDSYTEVTILPAKAGLPVPVTAYFKAGASVGHTPLGWLTRTQIHEAEGTQPDKMVPFEGESVRLSRSLAVALRAMALPIPTEDLFDLIAEVKEFREANGEITGWLRDAVVEKLWEDKKAKSAPDLEGRIILRISGGVLEEYRIELEIGFLPPKGRPATRSVIQWTTRIRNVGSTTITPPFEARQKLEN